jgi:neutral/alkaline ceramidase-like enzyme
MVWKQVFLFKPFAGFRVLGMAQRFLRFILSGAICLSSNAAFAETQNQMRAVGVAKIDITPNYPIRLTGYASRQKESEGVAQKLYAGALAIGSDSEKPALLITVENCGIPAAIRDQVAARLRKKKHIDPNRFALCSTHTHTGPWVEGFAPNIFGGAIPKDQAQRVKRYTGELTDALVNVALRALENRSPARLTRGLGKADFAANRRTKGGPVDHDLPALFVTGGDGKLRAILLSYACHCTTLGGEFNQICGDWAGYAVEDLEREHPGSVAMVALGCAGDANPNPRSTLELARQHGQETASAVEAILKGQVSPVEGELVCRSRQIELPFEDLPTRADWQLLAQQTNFVGSHARLNLARLKRGEQLPISLPYMIQTWIFGDNLALVFLPGEVVVDYSLRLKQEFDATRLWINAYANDVPCYIPSERILQEGGYEGGGAMVYYDKPTRLATGIENAIVQTVHELLPAQFARQTAKTENRN